MARLAKGADGSALRLKGGVPTWASDAERSVSEDFNAYATTDQVINLTSAGAAFTGVATTQHQLYAPSGFKLRYLPLGSTNTAEPAIIAAGLDVGAEQTADDGYELISHVLGASGGSPFIVGTSAAFYFLCKFEIADASGLDHLLVGFRRASTFQQTFTDYADYFGLGVNTAASPMAIKTLTGLNGTDGNTDTTQTLAAATAVQFKILVSAAGVVTCQHDIATPGTLAAPSAASALTFDAGDPVIPCFRYLHDTGLAGAITIHKWEAGYQ
jgi:hypothetical protein